MDSWADQVNGGASAGAFVNISITKPEDTQPSASSLSSSRSYSLALSPQIVYARSALLQYLVSSKVYRQLEFLAVGSWWVYSVDSDAQIGPCGTLLKVPNGREDVFQDQVLDFKAKRALMKFLRFISEYEEQPEIWEEHRAKPFPKFLAEQFKVPTTLLAPLLALALSSTRGDQTATEYALPRIARHLRSIGVFGPGFGAVIPKWGGMSEITQVGCRASAVGGGVYVLGKGLSNPGSEADVATADGIKLQLKDGESITAKHVVESTSEHTRQSPTHSRSITIVSSSLQPLFPPIAEDAPLPASAVVVFPSGTLSVGEVTEEDLENFPVHIFVHSSDTGECPTGQSILYASTALPAPKGPYLLRSAISSLLSTVDVTPTPTVLYSVQYERSEAAPASSLSTIQDERILRIPPTGLDLAFDDESIEGVKDVWRKIVGDGEDVGEFLVFEDREGNADDDE